MKDVIIVYTDSRCEIQSVKNESTTVTITDITVAPKNITERNIEIFPYKGINFNIVREADVISDDRIICAIEGIQ
ncbi:TPA: hypothetical protein RG683_000588 [Morganella morganii]|uniref:hypothetical protein n=1 Tax=Morganella morganii TaxID=582 RepID=UPI0006624DD2|nr:hypothetical protein [Morganella morganii]MBT0345471.1 hypothetical protein [Morganella morganii subsp. morganii]MBV7311178.1 hypothetical protein [Morganella morganii]PCP72158.1 hypothetical protein CQA25_14635 [Morganella morganii]HDU8567034.1 hypothetical protein [Morganella morganii]